MVKKKIEEVNSKVIGEWDCRGENIGLPKGMIEQRLASLPPEERKKAEEDQKASIEAEIERLEQERDATIEAAIASYQRAVEIKPSQMNVYRTIAAAYEQLGRPEEAIATYEAAAAVNPKSAEPFIYLAPLG